MKKLFLYLSLSVFAVTITAIAQQEPQDLIRQNEAITLTAPLGWWGWTNTVSYPGALDSMRNKAGIDVIHFGIDSVSQMNTIVNDYGFDVMVSKMTGLGLNYVMYYTHSKYTVWEAEGNEDYGVNLRRNLTKTEVVDTIGDTVFVRRRGDILNSVDEMINGPEPWYSQDVKYHSTLDSLCTVVDYTAGFRLMIEANDPPVLYNPNDTICRIQVTQRVIGGCTYVIADSILTLDGFDLNQFKNFEL